MFEAEDFDRVSETVLPTTIRVKIQRRSSRYIVTQQFLEPVVR